MTRRSIPFGLGLVLLIGVLTLVYGSRLTRLDVPIQFHAQTSLTPGSNLLWRSIPNSENHSVNFDQVDLPLALSASKMTSEGSSSETLRLNYPFGYSSIDFPTLGDRGNTAVVSVLGLIFSDAALISNVFY
jgi:hypothetical protein